MWPLQKIKNAAATVGASVKNLSNNMMVVEESPENKKIQNLIDLDEPITQEMTISELVNKFQTIDLPLIQKQFDAWQSFEVNCNQLKASLKSIDQESQKQLPINFELQTFYRSDQFNDRLNRLTNDILELSKIKYAPLVKENRQLKQKLQAQPATQEMQKAIDSLKEEKEYFKNEQIKLSLEYNALEQSLTSKISDLQMKNQVKEMEKIELNKQIDEYIHTINNTKSNNNNNISADKLRQLKNQIKSLRSELLTIKQQPIQFNFDYAVPKFTNTQIPKNINQDKLQSLMKMVEDYKKIFTSADLQKQLENDAQFILNLFAQLEQYSIKQIEQFNHQFKEQQNQILLLQEQISYETKEKEKLKTKLHHENKSLKSIYLQIIELKQNQSDIQNTIKQFKPNLTEIELQLNSKLNLQENQIICIQNLNEKYVNQLNGTHMLLEDTQHQLEKCYNQIYEKDQLLSIQYISLQELQCKLEQYEQHQIEIQDQQQLMEMQQQVEQIQEIQETPEQQNDEIPKQQSYIERLNMQLQDIYEHDELQQQQIANLRQENAQLKQNQLNYESEDKLIIEKLKEQIKQFINLNQQLQLQIYEKEKENMISQQFIDSLEEQLSQIKSNYADQLNSLTEYVKDKIKLSQDGQNVDDELQRKQEILDLQSSLKQQLAKQLAEETELKGKIKKLEQQLIIQEQEFQTQQKDLIEQKNTTIENCLKENAEQIQLNQQLHEKDLQEYEQQINMKEQTIQKMTIENREFTQQQELIINNLKDEYEDILKQKEVTLQIQITELQEILESKDKILTENDLQFKTIESDFREQIKILNEEIENLQSQLQIQKEKLNSLEDSNLLYQNDIEKLNEQLNPLKLSQESQSQEVMNLKNTLDSVSQELEQLKLQINEKDQELLHQNQIQEEQKQSMELKLKELFQIKQEHNDLEQEWEIQRNNFNEQLRAQEIQIEENQVIIAEQLNKLQHYSQLQTENNELLIQIDEINQQLVDRNHSNIETNQQLQEYSSKIEKLELQIKSQNEQIEISSKQVQTLNTQIDQLQNELMIKQQQIEKEELENQNVSNMIVELESSTQKAEFEKQQAFTERDDLKRNMNHLEQKIMTLNEQMLQLNDENDGLIDQLKKQKLEIQKLNELKQSYDILIVELGLCLTIEISEQFEKNKQQIISSIQSLKEQLRKEEDKVKLLAIKNTELQGQLSEIQNKVINEYQKKELSSQQELQQVQQKLNENIEKQNYSQQQLQKLEQKRKELEQKIADLEKNKKEQDQDIVNKKNEIEAQKQQLKNKQNELQSLGQQFQTQASEISKLQEQCNLVIQKNQEIQKLQKKCQSYEETIIELNGGVQNLQMVNEIQQQKWDLMQKEYEDQIKQLKATVVEVPIIEDNLQQIQELQQKIRKKEEQIVILINEKEQLNESYVKKIEEINLSQQNLVDKRIIKDFLINYFDNRTPHKVRLSLLETICCILTMNDREREKIGLHIQRLNQALLQQKSNDKTLKDNFIDYLLNG